MGEFNLNLIISENDQKKRKKRFNKWLIKNEPINKNLGNNQRKSINILKDINETYEKCIKQCSDNKNVFGKLIM